MKVVFRREVLLRLMKLASLPVKGTNVATLATHVLVSIQDGLATVTSTGTLDTLSFTVPVDALDGAMKLALPYRLSEVIDAASKPAPVAKGKKKAAAPTPLAPEDLGRITFALDATKDKALSMRVGSFKTDLTGQVFVDELQGKVDDRLPRYDRLAEREPISIDPITLLRAVEEVRYTIGNKRNPDHQGARIFREGSTITVAATNGSAMARVNTGVSAPEHFDDFMIPDTSLSTLSALLESATSLTIRRGESTALFEMESSDIEGSVRYWTEILQLGPLKVSNSDNETEPFEVEKVTLLSAINVAAALRPQIFEFMVRDGVPIVTGQDALGQISEVEVPIPASELKTKKYFFAQPFQRAITEARGSKLSVSFGPNYVRISPSDQSSHYLATAKV